MCFVLFCCKHKWLWRLLPSAPYAGGLAAIDWNIMRSLCYLWVGWPYKKALLFLLNMYGQEKGNSLLSEERKEWCTVLPCILILKTCSVQLKYSCSIFGFFFLLCIIHTVCHLYTRFPISGFRITPREPLQRLPTRFHHRHHAKLKINFSKIKTEVLQV